MAPRRSGSVTSETRDRLIDVTEQLMVAEGYAAVSSRRVAEGAGVTAASVYYYFPSMDDLFLASFERQAQARFARLQEVLREEALLTALWRFSGEREGAALLTEFAALATHRARVREAMLAQSDRFRRAQLEAISRRLPDYGLDEEEVPPAALQVFLSSVPILMLGREAHGLTEGRRQAAEAFERLLGRLEERRRAAAQTAVRALPQDAQRAQDGVALLARGPAGASRTRAPRGDPARQLILVTAERLFAERGIAAVSNRHISEAAGQRNSAAVGYHFGTKADLLHAISRLHGEQIERRRQEMIEALPASPGVREWVSCIVRPSTDHLASLGDPTTFARLRAQIVTDPAYASLVQEDRERSPALRAAVAGLARCLPELPERVYRERREMSVQLLVHGCADREQALADGRPTLRSSWEEAATGIVDATVGLWLAPVTVTEGEAQLS